MAKVKVLEGPKKSTRAGKKKMVVVEVNGRKKTIHYGDTAYKHNYSKAANKNFRSRHSCSEKTDKSKAGYWACRDLWPTRRKQK
jgi:hypothetical protein